MKYDVRSAGVGNKKNKGTRNLGGRHGYTGLRAGFKRESAADSSDSPWEKYDESDLANKYISEQLFSVTPEMTTFPEKDKLRSIAARHHILRGPKDLPEALLLSKRPCILLTPVVGNALDCALLLRSSENLLSTL